MQSDASASKPNPKWSKAQEIFLELLQHEENRRLSKLELCRKAGFAFAGVWYTAIKYPEFQEAVKAIYAEAERQKANSSSVSNSRSPQWSKTQQIFLDLLHHEENRTLTRLELCRKAGFDNSAHWYRAVEDPHFRKKLEAMGVQVERGQFKPADEGPKWGKPHQRLLEVLEVEENRKLTITELCRKAGYESKRPWYRAIEHPQFREAVEAMGIVVERIGLDAMPRERLAEPKWSSIHQTLLDLLQLEENRQLTIKDLCGKAGFDPSYWHKSLRNSQFRAAVEALGVSIERHEMSSRGQTRAQRKILEVLQDEANRKLPIVQICHLAGYPDDFWYKALKSEEFVKAVETLGVKIRRREYNENGWTEVQQNLLNVVQDPATHQLPITEICQRAGYPDCSYWFRALKNSKFASAVESLGVEIWWNGRNKDGLTRAQQRFLDFLKDNPVITAGELCRELGYTSTGSWTEAIQDRHFVETLEELGIQVHREERRKDGWTWAQVRLLSVLQNEDNRDLPIYVVSQLAGYSTTSWYRALKRPNVRSAIRDLQVRLRRCGPDEDGWTQAQRRILKVLRDEENRYLSIPELVKKAGYSAHERWYTSLNSEQFLNKLHDWEVPVVRQQPPFTPHNKVKLSMSLEEDLKKDIWDMRTFKPDYRKHRDASQYIVDFTWISNLKLREQVKHYFRQYLPNWQAGTFSSQLWRLRGVLAFLPPEVDLETITREHIEAILPEVLNRHSDSWVKASLETTRSMFNYMAYSQSWNGPRPPKDLVIAEDMPSPETPLPRPIPPDVLDQLDPLLEQAIQDIIDGREPPILEPIFWDAILILRRTGMRFADLAHLEAPNANNRGGCLGQDSNGDWWIHIRPDQTKTGKEHQIPTIEEDGVVDAILRQRERSKDTPDHFGESYLFRTQLGVLTYSGIIKALEKLSPYLTYAGEPYAITAHQFRHTIATDMIDKGVDVIAVQKFLGHTSLTMTLRYIKVYRKNLQVKYQQYQAKVRQQKVSTPIPSYLFPSNITLAKSSKIVPGWVEGYEGRLFHYDLPTGLGVCEQPPMLQLPCVSGQCSTACTKLRAGKQHLSAWENRITGLQTTIETLQDYPGYNLSCEQHERELKQAEKVVATIQKEGFWDGRVHNA